MENMKAMATAIDNVSSEKELTSVLENRINPFFLHFVRVIWLYLSEPFKGTDSEKNYLPLIDVGK